MSEYTVSNAILRDKIQTYDKQAEKFSSQFSDLSDAVNSFCQSTCFRGKAADKIMAYMNGTYGNTIYMMSSLAGMIAARFAAYANKYFELDGSYKAVIPTEKLMDMCDFLQKEQEAVRQANDTFKAQSDSLLGSGDMKMAYEYSAGESTVQYYTTITEKIHEWNDRIHTIEESEINSEFSDLDALMDKLESLLKYTSTTDPQDFKPSTYQGHLNECSSAFINSASKTSNMSKQVESAHEAIGKMEEAEKEDRRKETAWLTGIVDVGCALANVAATVAFGPAGTIVVGAITGAVKSAVHEGVDQYIENGSVGNWGKVLLKGAIGGATGAATAAIGQGFKGLAGLAGSSTSVFGKAVTKIALNAGQGMANTLVSHAGSFANQFVDSVAEGKSWSEAWDDAGAKFHDKLDKEMFTSVTSAVTSGILDYKLDGMAGGLQKSLTKIGGKAVVAATNYTIDCAVDPEKNFDAREMFAKAGSAGFTATVSEIGDAVGRSTGYSQWANDEKSNTAGRYIMKGIVGGAESVITKNGGAAVETLIRTGDTGAAVEAMKENALENFAEGTGSAVIRQYGEDHWSAGKTKTLEETRDQYGNVVHKKERVYYADGRSVIRETKTTVTVNEETGTTTTVEDRTYYKNKTAVGWGQKVTEEKEKGMVDAGNNYKEVTEQDHYKTGWGNARTDTYRTHAESVQRGTGYIHTSDDKYERKSDWIGNTKNDHSWSDQHDSPLKESSSDRTGSTHSYRDTQQTSWTGRSTTESYSESHENRYQNGTAFKTSESHETRYHNGENRGYTREENTEYRDRDTNERTVETERWNQERGRTFSGYRRERDDYSRSTSHRQPAPDGGHAREKTTYTTEQRDVWKENPETGSDEHVERRYRKPRSEYKP